MKMPSTSFTKQQEMLRCPRRFYYRYLDNSPRAQSLKKLMSVRELGGHCIHSILAGMVRRIANGDRVSDQTTGVRDALMAFDNVVQRSICLRPGVLSGQMQLAESHNGLSCEEQTRDWREIIPIAVTNGIRMMDHFDLRTDHDGYRLEAEQEFIYLHRGRKRHLVIDVLINDRVRGTSILDFKTHKIADRDLDQLSLYQQALLELGRAHPTRIFGFAIDLLHERIVEHHYHKVRSTWAQAAIGTARPGKVSLTISDGLPCAYTPKPNVAACSICPFAAMCPASALPLLEVDHGF